MITIQSGMTETADMLEFDAAIPSQTKILPTNRTVFQSKGVLPMKTLIPGMENRSLPARFKKILVLTALFTGLSAPVHATQMHKAMEGILVHQLGHLFFLFSMVILIFTIHGKKLHQEKGWRLIQYSALFFILWNLDAVTAHFLDNQIHAVRTSLKTMTRIHIEATGQQSWISWLYYLLRLDHLLCLPAMVLLYRGLTHLVRRETP